MTDTIRLFDILLSGLALIALAPFFVVVMIALRLTGEGEVFYRQMRVGKGGRMFGLLKFVTMRKDSESTGSELLTIKNDPRVLPLGRILRKIKINELPQLVNVFMGDMSL
ncbi:MAG: sugar transferase, partial [Burkholderiales bacterium]